MESENDVNMANIDNHVHDKGNLPKRTDEQRKELRRSYRLLLEETAKFDEVEPSQVKKNLFIFQVGNSNLFSFTKIDKKKFGKALKRNSALFRQVDRPQEALLDAQNFKQLSRLTRSQVEALSTNKQKFILSEFGDKLATFLSDNGGLANGRGFQTLGKNWMHVFQRAAALTYLNGSIEKSEPKMKEKKQRQTNRRSLNVDLSLATQTEDGKTCSTETVGALTEILVESTLDQLKIAFDENDQMPISYLEFVLDPQSFSKSIENMFHFSFLIKEGRAALKLDDHGKGLPFAEPIKVKKSLAANDESGKGESKHQAIISLDYDQWEDMIQQLDLKEPMIKHDVNQLRRKRRESVKKAKIH